jgi:hypothetical protein
MEGDSGIPGEAARRLRRLRITLMRRRSVMAKAGDAELLEVGGRRVRIRLWLWTAFENELSLTHGQRSRPVVLDYLDAQGSHREMASLRLHRMLCHGLPSRSV